ncbi:hypothetical protein POPTR_008G044600v4 [Populus trichocarpa]|uniref:Uncharacterized protein n=2 Tax=Populus TaxID=3689 RepID=A0ACC0SJL2_POPTR|nr:uncharacterized protein LOC7469767 isoform X1 [Populus trichocarpa]XP_024462372.1 uncharacterized protein LOC7469767 isoform X1 [Populus trichocarpa]AXY97741.1 Tudor/PWWP/MBT superfamily protein [Populus tomentosa]KAI9389425.1 hypothetical protein POPTR_008G044600v4 [Populus trichocarpa]|eukprot:XP_024462371.1 uncharacterized protein LOC7469767 isoform X1 [Populus trichocarpa]
MITPKHCFFFFSFSLQKLETPTIPWLPLLNIFTRSKEVLFSMDECKNESVSARSVAELSTVSVSEHVDSGDSEKTTIATTPVVVGSVASEEAQGKIECSSSEDVMAKEVGSCNGDEVMVERSSSEGVDGGCTRDLCDGGGGEARKETAGGCGCAEGDATHSDGGGVAGHLGTHENRDSGVDPSNSGFESSRSAESEEGKPVESGEKGREVSGNSSEASPEVQELRVESEVGQSSKVAESEGEGKAVEGGEEDMEVGGNGDKTSSEVGVADADAHVQSVENASGIGGETQVVVEEVTFVTTEESLKRELVEEGVEGEKIDASQKVTSQEIGLSENESQDQRAENGAGCPSVVVGASVGETQVVEKSELVEEAAGKAEDKDDNVNDALQDSETLEVGVLHDEVWNSGTETAVLTSPSTVEDTSVETEVTEEVAVLANNEGLDPKVEASRSDALERALAGNSEGLISASEGSSVLPEKDGLANPDSKLLDKQTPVADEGRVASTDDENITCPNTEGMDTDGFSESFYFSVEELQGTSETANGSTENGYNVCADLQPSYQPAQVVVRAGVVAKENIVVLNPVKSKKVITECLVNDAEEAGLHKEQVITVSQQQKTDIVSGSTETRTKTECGGMEIDVEVALTNNVEVLISHTDVPDPSLKDQQLKTEEGSGKSASCHPAHVDSIEEQLMEGQEQATYAEELEGEKKRVEEQSSQAETESGITELDTRLMDGEENVIASNEEALNPQTELKELAESDQQLKVAEGLDEGASHGLFEMDSHMGQEMTIEEHVLDAEQVDLLEGKEMEVEEQDTDNEQLNSIEEKSAKLAASKPGSSEKADQACYLLPPNNEGELSVSDLVWGKVRSHPWWPGQIFDPSDASEKAVKYNKKDCYLVAYFGDRTFAWNEASLLKPFRSHFSQVEKQSNSEVFQNAVDCALEEVSRRVELGLACSCVPEDAYDEIKFQVLESAGIRPEASTRDGVDKDTSADLFQPDKLVGYMKALAQTPAGGANRLELVIAKSQLLAFYRLKGYSELPEYQFYGGLLENSDTLRFEDEVIDHAPAVYEDHGQISSGEEILQTQRRSSRKCKHNLKDCISPRKKERNLSDLMGDSWDSLDDEIASDGKANNKLVSPSSGKKRKGADTFADDASMTEGRKTISFAKVSSTTTLPKPSFKIGECIQRVASQMTGSPSILKCNSQKVEGSSDGLIGDGSDTSSVHPEDAEIKKMIVPSEYSSLDELLSQLHLTAQDPSKGFGFLNIIISFFSDFRNSVVMDQHDKVGGKRKTSHSSVGFPETFEFEDMNDTYWTDRVIQNGSEEQPPRKSRKRDNLFVPVVLDKPSGRSNSRKRYSDSSYDVSTQKPVGYVDEKAPAELVMHFPVVDSVPSEISLNKMFRRFGPLKESETEVDRDTNRARVIFKRCSDAEAAYGSAPKFNIFGPILVNYQLNYTISVPFKTPPPILDEEDVTLFLQY